MFLYRHLKARILESQTASNQNEKKMERKKNHMASQRTLQLKLP